MSKNKTKLIILLYFCYKYFVEISVVSCRSIRSSRNENFGDDDSQARVWRDQFKDQPKWQMEEAEPYINVVRGRSREWSNLEHAQPLKRSDEAAAEFPDAPLESGSLGALNLSNPISKYHCPINLLYGNNLTVKNYFLLMPRANESCNDTIQQIQSVGDEVIEKKTMPVPHGATEPAALGAQGATVQVMTMEATAGSAEANVTLESNATVESTVGTTSMPEFNATAFGNFENKTVELMVEVVSVSPKAPVGNASAEISASSTNASGNASTEISASAGTNASVETNASVVNASSEISVSSTNVSVETNVSVKNTSTEISASSSNASVETNASAGHNASVETNTSAGNASAEISAGAGSNASAETNIKVESNATVESTMGTTSVPELNVTAFGNLDNKTVEVMVEMISVSSSAAAVSSEASTTQTSIEMPVETTVPAAEHATQGTPFNASAFTLSADLMRTLDKYCETFNLTDHGQYTINPVSINHFIEAPALINILDEEKPDPGDQRKQKRTPHETCVKFNMSEEQNYTIQPVKIPEGGVPISLKAKESDLKKQKRNLTSKRPKKRSKSVKIT